MCVIACTNYGQELLNVLNGADDKVVVLTAWSSDTAAVYQMATTKVLLWRADAEDSWCEFPSKEATDLKPKPDGKSVTVRPGLEVVLPHPDVVAELVGSDLITALQSPSEVSADLVVRRLDDILGRKGGAAAVAAAGKCAHALWVALRDAHRAVRVGGTCGVFSLPCAQPAVAYGVRLH